MHAKQAAWATLGSSEEGETKTKKSERDCNCKPMAGLFPKLYVHQVY
jgi:hypothetical protein